MTNAQTNQTAANARNVTTLPLPEYLNVKGVSALTGMSAAPSAQRPMPVS